MVGEGRALGGLLVACIQSDGQPIDEAIVRRARPVLRYVMAAADHHGIAMAVHLALTGADIPDDLRDQLSASFQFWRNRNLIMTLELARVAKILDEAKCRWLAFKGPVLAETIYPRNDLRSYADLDLLVDSQDFSTAVLAIEHNGGLGVETQWERVLHELKGELNFALPSQVVLDLHWSLLYNATIRSQFRWSDRDALARRVDVSLVRRVDVPTLDPVDTFLHLALHACIAGGQKLCWMRDVSLAGATIVDFDEVVRRALAQGVGLPVGVMLAKTRRTLGVARWDAELERRLCGPELWTSVMAELDRFRPPQNWLQGSLTGHIICASTRTTSRASLREFGTRARTELDVLRADPGHPWRQRFPGLSSFVDRPPPAPRGGSLAFRNAYLTAVVNLAD